MNPSFLVGLVIGCIIGFIGNYLLHSMSGVRRRAEIEQEKEDEWDAFITEYPAFIEQLQHDINEPVHAQIREFFVVDKNALMNSSIPRLRYDLSEDLLQALNKLEDLGYIYRLLNDALLYKMEEAFIKKLKHTDIANITQ
jgi:gas vesicle protein